MSALQAWVASFASQHPVVFAIVVVPFLTAFINAAIRYFKSANWASYQATHPRLAALMKVSKAWGFDPVGGLMYLYTVITGKPWSDGSSGGDGGSSLQRFDSGDVPPAEPKDKKALRRSSRRAATLFDVPVRILLPRPARVIYGQALLAAVLVVVFVSIASCNSLVPPSAPSVCEGSACSKSAPKRMSPEDCSKLARGEIWAASFGYGGAVGTMAVGGAAGVAGLEKGVDKTALVGLAIGAGVLGAFTLGSTIVARGKAAQYVAEGCGVAPPVPPPPLPMGSASAQPASSPSTSSSVALPQVKP